MKYAVTYNENIYVESQMAADMEKCTCVTFENQGDESVTINKGITLAAGCNIVFENQPNEFIDQSFKIVFAGGGTSPRLLVIKKFVRAV